MLNIRQVTANARASIRLDLGLRLRLGFIVRFYDRIASVLM